MIEKKYEIIKAQDGLTRIRALKDFTLITSETVKKGDIGGYVYSENCLSQEGNCWAMYRAFVYGTVYGNAVVKDFAHVRKTGIVSGDAIIRDDSTVEGTVSGNAIVKDHGFVGVHATVTGKAVVKEHQRINYGTVTTDLLGTKDWVRALYAEFGIDARKGKALLYKKVWSTNSPDIFTTAHNEYQKGQKDYTYKVGEITSFIYAFNAWFTALKYVDKYEGNTILECEIDIDDIYNVQNSLVNVQKCKVKKVKK